MSCVDTLFMQCHYEGCEFGLERRAAHNAHLAPSELIRWHERMITHIRKTHLRKRRSRAAGIPRHPIDPDCTCPVCDGPGGA